MSKVKSHHNIDYLTPREVADIMMVTPMTIRKWAEKGIIKALTTPGGHRRYLRKDIEEFVNSQKPKGKTKILIVDDDIQFLELYKEILENAPLGAHVEIAQDGFEAGSKVLSFKPDALLLDLNMPGLDGYTVCEKLKSNPDTAFTRVIAVSGNASPENTTRIISLGAETCLEKPIDVNRLLKTFGIL